MFPPKESNCFTFRSSGRNWLTVLLFSLSLLTQLAPEDKEAIDTVFMACHPRVLHKTGSKKLEERSGGVNRKYPGHTPTVLYL